MRLRLVAAPSTLRRHRPPTVRHPPARRRTLAGGPTRPSTRTPARPRPDARWWKATMTHGVTARSTAARSASSHASWAEPAPRHGWVLVLVMAGQ